VEDTPTVQLAVAGSKSTAEQTPINIDLLMQDKDPLETLSCSKVSAGVAGVNVTLSSSLEPALEGSVVDVQPANVNQISYCRITITPPVDAHGAVDIAVKVTDSTLRPSSTLTIPLTVTPVNDSPTFAASIVPQSTTEETPLTVNFTGSDVDGALACTSAHLSATVTEILPLGQGTTLLNSISSNSWGGTWPNCNLTLNPSTNAHGSATIGITINDNANGGNSTGIPTTTTSAFTLTVNKLNDTPVLSSVSVPTVTEDQSSPKARVLFDIDDNDGALDCSTNVTPTVLDATKLASVSVGTQAGTGKTWRNCYAELTLVAHANGAAQFKLTLNDQGNGDASGVPSTTAQRTAEETVSITIDAVNDVPSITDVTDKTINEGGSQTLTLEVEDFDNTAFDCTSSQLSVSAGTIGGQAVIVNKPAGTTNSSTLKTSCTVTLTPEADAYGSATVTITATDIANTFDSTSFTLTVNNINDKPTLNLASATATVGANSVSPTVSNGNLALTIDEDQNVTVAGIVLTDIDSPSLTCVNGLALSTPAGASGLLPVSADNTGAVVVTETGSTSTTRTCSIQLSPVADQSGQAVLTLKAIDGGQASYTADEKTITLNVSAKNDAPVITNSNISQTNYIHQIVVDEDVQSSNYAVAVTDVDNSNMSCSSIMKVDSKNKTVLPDANITFTGTAPGTCQMKVKGALNQNSASAFEVEVWAEDTATVVGVSEKKKFSVVITPVNDAPVISAIAKQTIVEDTSIDSTVNKFKIPITITDPESIACNSSTLSYVSSRTSIITNDDDSITFAENGGTCWATFTTQPNSFGTTSIIFVAKDSDGAEGFVSFALEMTRLPDAPSIVRTTTASTTTTETTYEDTPLVVEFTLTDVDTTSTAPVNPAPSCAIVESNASAADKRGKMTVTYSSGLFTTLPTAAVVNGKCQLTFSPVTNLNDNAGNTSISVTLHDSVEESLPSSPSTFNVRVIPRNDAPEFNGTVSNVTMSEDGLGIVTVSFKDIDDSLACSSTYLDYELVAPTTSNLINTSGAISWSDGTPATSDGWTNCVGSIDTNLNIHGNTQMKIKLKDLDNGDTAGVANTEQTILSNQFTLTVTPVNDDPVITLVSVDPSNATVTEDPASNLKIYFNISDPDGSVTCADNMSYSASTQSKVTAVNIATNAGATPASTCSAEVDFAEHANGAVTITLEVNDKDNGSASPVVAQGIKKTVAQTITVTPVNDTPAGTPQCQGTSANIFKTGLTTSSTGWELTSCSGVTDPDTSDTANAQTLTYSLVLQSSAKATGESGDLTCPTSTWNAATSKLSGSFPTTAGSCSYKIRVCDNNNPNSCATDSSNYVVITSYAMTVSTPAKPSLPDTCAVTASSNISYSGNISSVSWEGKTYAPGYQATSGTNTSASFTTTISNALLLGTSLLPTTLTKQTTYPADSSLLTPTIQVLSGNITGVSSMDPPSSDLLSAVVNGGGYRIQRDLENLSVRKGMNVLDGSNNIIEAGKATSLNTAHSDGQQADFATASNVCRTCSATNASVLSLSAGNEHTCVVESDGTNFNTRCFGKGISGRLGNGGTANTAVPTAISNPGTNAHQMVAAGFNFTCLMSSADVRCWGSNSASQLGLDPATTSSSSAPGNAVSIPDSGTLISLAASKFGQHACAVRDNGNAYCWGQQGSSGKLGNGGTTNSHNAVKVMRDGSNALQKVRSIAVGKSHTCAAVSYDAANTAVSSAGVYCWGSNTSGQLGVDSATSTSSYAIAASTTNRGSASTTTWFTQVVAGEDHTCTLRSDGEVFCWGRNDYGQLGNNTTTDSFAPVQVKTGTSTNLTGVVSLTAGANHTCAIKNDHSVLCWGSNDYGQLGVSGGSSSLAVTALPAGSSNLTAAISAGGSHTCALMLDGSMSCWGDNSFFQLGSNASSGYSPAQVNWSTSGGTLLNNSKIKPNTCHRYTIP
jgi:alpha-tubulin suppressor-like RCC1 family protein